MAVGDRVRSLVLRAAFVVLAPNFREFQPQPTDAGMAAAPGPDPLRILLLGAGVAAGYGVRSNALALSGQLATTVAATFGRGCQVETSPLPTLSRRRIETVLSATRIAGYDVVVYLPSFAAASNGVAPARWVRELRRLIRDVKGAGGPALTVVLTGLPLPPGSSWPDRTSRDHSARLNRAIAAVAAKSQGVRYVDLPDPPRLQELRRFDPEYYRLCADRIAPVLLDGQSASSR